MSTDGIYILVIHAVIILVQFVLGRMFPSQKKALIGVYFILLPVGFLFFAELPPIIPAVMVIAGVFWVFYHADRVADSDKEQKAGEKVEV